MTEWQAAPIRTFESGATRNTDANRIDPEAFMSPAVLELFSNYMNRNRTQADGSIRDGDNWQKGIPRTAYMKSMWRHFLDVWKNHRGLSTPEDQLTNLMGLMFNVMGYAYELLQENGNAGTRPRVTNPVNQEDEE